MSVQEIEQRFYNSLNSLRAYRARIRRNNKIKNLKSRGLDQDDDRKRRAVEIAKDYEREAKWYGDIPAGTLSRIVSCDSWANFLATHDNSHKVLRRAMFCGARFCPICQHRRSILMNLKLSTIMKAIIRHAVRRGHKADFLFVTLTVPNTSTNPAKVKGTIRKLHQSFRKMMKYKRYDGWSYDKSGKRKKGIVLGAFSKIEETTNYSRTKPFHIHLHALLTVHSSYFKSRYYVPKRQWQEDWDHATKSKIPLSISIRHCYYKDSKNSFHTLENTPKKDIPKVINKATEEIAKYPTKPEAEQKKALASRGGKPKHAKSTIFHNLYVGFRHQRFYTFFGDFNYYSKAYENGDLEDLMPQNPHTFSQEDNTQWKKKNKIYDHEYQPLNKDDIEFCKNHNLKFITENQIKKRKAMLKYRNRAALDITYRQKRKAYHKAVHTTKSLANLWILLHNHTGFSVVKKLTMNQFRAKFEDKALKYASDSAIKQADEEFNPDSPSNQERTR